MRTRTIAVIACLALAGLATFLILGNQPPKQYRIGVLMVSPSASTPSRVGMAAFRQGLSELGHVEGQNLVIDYRYAEHGPKDLPGLAAELVNLKVDVIVTGSSDATRAAQQATTTIPIVMAVSAAPELQGFVASLARPGGNITGLSMLAPQVAAKRLEYLKEAVPKTQRVAVLRWPLDPATKLQWEETETESKRLGLELLVLELEGPAPDFGPGFDAAVRGKADALITLADPRVVANTAQIVALTNRHQLPAMFFERSVLAAGGLMAYGPDIIDMFRRAAGYVDRLIKGAKPGELPVEQPTKIDLMVNLTTAKALAFNFPQTFLRRVSPENVIR